ncbi:MAG: hypothetical protein ACYTEZ_03105 [Planctomycetota bacterium]|jgi:hypothetical protein
MQTELLGDNPATTIRILGVNAIGSESGNDLNCTDRDIPWLQDTAAEHVWTQWQVAYRDVIVLDDENRPVAVYSLTTYDLGDTANYDALKAILRQAAGE